MRREGLDWLPEEIAYLKSRWGQLSINYIATKLKRTEIAVYVKATKLKLGGLLEGRDYLIISDAAKILGVDKSTISFYIKKKELPCSKIQLYKRENYVIKFKDFITWLQVKPLNWNSTKADLDALLTLGVDKKFLLQKYDADTKELKRSSINPLEEYKIIKYYKEGYTYDEMCELLDKTYSTVKSTISRLLKEEKITESRNEKGRLGRRPVISQRGWTAEQDRTLIELYLKGYLLKDIANIVGKSLSSTKTRNQVLTRRLMEKKSV